MFGIDIQCLLVICCFRYVSWLLILFLHSFDLLAAVHLELLLYNCQLLCFWRLALSIVVEVYPRPFFSGYCSFKDVYCKFIMPNFLPYP